jgi:hypothetical protein
MKGRPTKIHPAVGCCGIDCGLCPRHNADGKSRCPGCAGKGFFDTHPTCSILSCCLTAKGLEACSDCESLMCAKVEHWDRADSFVTHRNCLTNLKTIREKGWAAFLEQQEKRMRLLENLLKRYNDGRTKSFYCLSAALLPIEELEAAVLQIANARNKATDRKETAMQLREAFAAVARRNNVELSYRKNR